MCSLASFPPPPPLGYVTICERNGVLEYTVAKLAHDRTVLQDYPNITVSVDSSRPTILKESARSAFLEHEDSLRKRLYKAWYESGTVGVLEELAGADSDAPTWLSSIASHIIGTVRWALSFHGTIFPHLTLSKNDLIAEFSKTLDWRESPVRCFAWHPHTAKFAVAHHDDNIKVYTLKKSDITPTLKHKLQKGISDIAWKPLSASVLAVACQSCILIWHVDPMSLASRPSTSSVQVLIQSNHAPVTSIAWHPNHYLLLSGSPADSSMVVWEVPTERNTALRRVGGGGVSLISWSPDGSKVLAACPSTMFRVWETRRWTCEQWSNLQSRIKTACWSADSTLLLFATEKEPIIYYLSFTTSLNETSSVIGGSEAVVCGNVGLVEIETEEGPVSVGGNIQSMVWDGNCERLAVQVTGSNSSSDLVVLFQTRRQPVFELIPCGFVRGFPGEKVQLLSFQPKYEEGAILTVVWDSGRIGFVPLYFLSQTNITNNHFQGQNFNEQILSPKVYSSPK